MTHAPVCLVSAGACTAVGLSAAASAAAVRADISGFQEHPSFVDRLDEPVVCAMPPGAPGAGLAARCTWNLRCALTDALQALPQKARRGVSMGKFFIAAPELRPGVPESFAEDVARNVREAMPAAPAPVVASLGNAGGGIALASMFDRLREGETDWVVVAGIDSYVSLETCAWLDASRQLHAGYNAWGLVPGESAGAMVLASLPAAQAADLRPLAVVEGIGVGIEAVPITATEGVCLGWGLTRAVRAALDLLPPAAVIDSLYCDHNGQPYRADEMGFMLARTGDRFRDPAAFIAPADCWGDAGAATVPLLVALILQAAERGYAAGPLNLVFAGSDSGQRVAMLLRTLEKERSW